MDFIERLCDKVNEIPGLPVKCRIGYLGTDESLVVYPLPGSRTVQEYMNGAKDQQLNYEFAMKSKQQSKIHNTLRIIQNKLEDLKDIESHNGSFEFDELIITSKPFIHNADEQGWFVFLLDVQANVTVLKEE